jgi:hypothetical protein
MNKKSENIYRVLWAVLFLVNLGASIALNYFPIETKGGPVDLASTPGWTSIVWNNGGSYFYNEQVGLVERDSGQAEQGQLVNRFGDLPFWLMIQLLLGTIGLVLVLIKRPQPIGFRHRLNIAFGFLMIAWINLAISAIRFQQEVGNVVPAGHVLIALPQAHQSPQFHGAEKLYVLALGLGVSIVLGYLWIRWDRATRPDEFFP